jgi:photosystem II stability/assembly factor-like uncharacterized protein
MKPPLTWLRRSPAGGKALPLLSFILAGGLGAVIPWCVPGVIASTWQLQSPQPTGADLQAGFMASPSVLWVAGEQGFILRATDGGADWRTWEVQETGTLDLPFFALSFASPSSGVAAGNRIMYTRNGGATWFEAAGGPLGGLYAVDLLDEAGGWGCGGGGVVTHTTNGGASWSSQNTPTIANLKAIDFVDGNRGWAVGGAGTIIATTNGGATWFNQTSGTSAFLDGVSFVSTTEGWAAGGNVIIHTTNGGTTWTPQSVPADAWVYDIHFVDPMHGWGAGADLSVICTTNGGSTWTTTFGGVGSSAYHNQPFNDIHFVDIHHGVAVGNGGLIYASDDGGLTWLALQNGAPGRAKVFALDNDHAWTTDEVCWTTDAGTTWTRTGERAADIVFTDAANGWLCLDAGPPPLVRRSTDGGRSWVGIPSAPIDSWRAVDTKDGQTVIVAGWDGNYARLARTTNGGSTWTLFPQGAFAMGIFYDVDMVTSQIGYAVGDGASIYKTMDGGVTWSAQSAGSIVGSIHSVSFVDPQVGWCVGGLFDPSSSDVVALRTTNGGQIWLPQPVLNGDGGLWSVSAVSASTAWVAGVEGFLARTTDGGATWIPESTGQSPHEYVSVAFVDAENGWTGSSGHSMRGPLRGGVFRRSSETAGIDPSTPGVDGSAPGAASRCNLLLSPAPNPFNGSTVLAFEIPRPSRVTLALYEANGRRIVSLIDGAMLATGRHETALQLRGPGARVTRAPASGVYFARLWLDGAPAGSQRLVIVQ